MNRAPCNFRAILDTAARQAALANKDMNLKRKRASGRIEGENAAGVMCTNAD